MATQSHRLIIEGEHRTWMIRLAPSFPGEWLIGARPIPAETNPLRNPDFSSFDTLTLYPDLTAAYEAYVAAEYADDGTSLDPALCAPCDGGGRRPLGSRCPECGGSGVSRP